MWQLFMELFTISLDKFLVGGWKFQKILYLRADFWYKNITVLCNPLRQKIQVLI